MSPPELPGYYYDTEKKKYFRIVNGDQRVNSSYSNNAIRVKERREKYQSSTTKKQKVQGGQEVDARADLSRVQNMASYSTDIRDQFLQVRLGLLSPENTFHHILSDYNELSELSPYSIWPGLDSNTCFLLQGSILKLFHADSNLLNASYTHALFPHLLVDPSTDNQASNIICLDNWVLVQFGKLFSLTKWNPIENNKYDVTDYTRQIESDICEAYASREAEPPSLENNSGSFQKIGTNLHLVLVLGSGSSVQYNMSEGSIFNIRRLPRPKYDQEIQNFRIMDFIWGFYYGKLLTLVNSRTFNSKTFSFESQIYYYELTIRPTQIVGSKSTLDLTVVTQKKVILRQIDLSTLRNSSVDQTVTIHNDNQSQPLIHKSGDYLIVEELPNVMKIINFALCLTERKSIEHSLPAIRNGKPRLVYFAGKLFWSDSTKCLEYR